MPVGSSRALTSTRFVTPTSLRSILRMNASGNANIVKRVDSTFMRAHPNQSTTLTSELQEILAALSPTAQHGNHAPISSTRLKQRVSSPLTKMAGSSTSATVPKNDPRNEPHSCFYGRKCFMMTGGVGTLNNTDSWLKGDCGVKTDSTIVPPPSQPAFTDAISYI